MPHWPTSTPSPQPVSSTMLDDLTLKTSFLVGLLFLVSLYVSRYFGLTGDPMVRPSPSYLCHIFTMTHVPARRNPNCRVFWSDSLVPLGFPICLSWRSYASRGLRESNCLSLHAPSSYQTDDTYHQSKPGLFKIANFRGWMVLATGPDLIDDIKRAPDNVLSTSAAKNAVCSASI